MKITTKSNFSKHAVKIPSKAADKLGVEMYAYARKNINTLKETIVTGITFTDDKGKITQTEDIIITGITKPNIDLYSSKLRKVISIPEEEIVDGKIKIKNNEYTCLRDFNNFVNREKGLIPVRMYYDNGYGWSHDMITGQLTFNGSSIIGIEDMIIDDYEHHLSKNGELIMTLEICNEIMKDKVVAQIILASSLAAPIFGALDLKSLIVNVAGASSQGKSTLLKLAMSLWSEPDDDKVSTTWNNTENAIVAKLNNIEGVPFLIDDTSQGKTNKFTNIVYNLEDGKSKGRLNKLFQVEKCANWHTLIYSASERTMYEKTDAEKKGILRRLVEVEINDGDLTDDENQARKINQVCSENYGLLGNEFIKKWIEQKLVVNNFKILKEKLELEINNIQNHHKFCGGVAKGLSEKFGVILLAAKLGNELLGLEFEINDLEWYVASLINKAEMKVKNSIVEKMDVDSCHKKIWELAEKELGNDYYNNMTYKIPIEWFNLVEAKLGYQKEELRNEFFDKGICSEGINGKNYHQQRIKGKSQKCLVIPKYFEMT